jgi:hypothetical protein
MSVSRRKFLRGAAATGTAALGLPMIVKAQGPISMRWQSTWPAKNIFHTTYRENTFHHPGVAETAMAGWKVIEENR